MCEISKRTLKKITYRSLCWKCRTYNPNPEKYKETKKRWNQNLKKEVLSYYGSKCECCNETELAFLTLDHIDGGGTEERKRKKRFGSNFYRLVKQNNYPKNLRVLCFNCNCGRQTNNGICPHQKGIIRE